MRFTQSQLAALCHGLHSSVRVATARPLQRPFHHTSLALRPRQRSFFTSNPFYAKDGSNDVPSPPSSPSQAESRPEPPQHTRQGGGGNRKKTAKTSAGAKKSLRDPLRHVASIAQRSDRRTPERSKDGESEDTDKDDRKSIRAICVAESFDMKEVVKILTNQWYKIDPDGLDFDWNDVVHARAGGAEGDVFVFPSGTVVTWSLPPEIGVNLATGSLLKAAENHHLRLMNIEDITEDLEYSIDPSTSTSSMRGDEVVLGTQREAETGGDRTDTTRAKIAFSSGLARSTKVAVLENSLERYFQRTRGIPRQLQDGKLRASRKYILQRTGELLQLRSQLNFYGELTDSLPDTFWNQRSELGLENIYDQVGKELDVFHRIRTLNQRMDYAQDISTVMREMSSDDHSSRLEWIIILLITFEVFLELGRIFRETIERWVEKDEAVQEETKS